MGREGEARYILSWLSGESGDDAEKSETEFQDNRNICELERKTAKQQNYIMCFLGSDLGNFIQTAEFNWWFDFRLCRSGSELLVDMSQRKSCLVPSPDWKELFWRVECSFIAQTSLVTWVLALTRPCWHLNLLRYQCLRPEDLYHCWHSTQGPGTYSRV